ncbi:MAG TPA: efflux RND transporter permease subunit, partial [Candidatus Avacidaminococcus intestinavium]|nr:efflux RND transporter permease subunit [Candidatus Avacidaminococcus intestinavium]
LEKKIKKIFTEEFTEVRLHTKVIQTGNADPYPIMLRVRGPEIDQVRMLANKVSDELAQDENLESVALDWNEKSKALKLEIDQAKARALGVSSQDLAGNLQALLSGVKSGEFREDDKTVDIVFRVDAESRNNLSNLRNINVYTGNGKYVSLDQIAKISYQAEEGIIWRRDLMPTITVQAVNAEGVLGDDAAVLAYERLAELRNNLPPGYSIELGGSAESSAKAIGWLMGPVPAMIFVIITILMLQVHNIPQMIITLLTAPLGLIGVSPALLVFGKPVGFVVELGILALAGIIIRNSVILIDQINRHLDAQEPLWDAIVNAAVTRFRPIMLTAAAAIMGMIPLMRSNFWGPMAVAIAGGLFVATILTLLVLPSMFAEWYKAEPPERQ